MKTTPRFTLVLKALFVLLAVAVLAAGCSSGKAVSKSESMPDHRQTEVTGPVPLYYDFPDVLIPGELKLDNNSSFVVRASNMSAGVLALKGRVELNSLIAFFANNMAKDNWVDVASFKSKSPRSVLLFKKDVRWCVINIDEGDFSTYVEIWVAPTSVGSESTLLN